jgi:tetratricopeptide (TPR) repeat protein
LAGFLIAKLSMRYLTLILIFVSLGSLAQVKKGDKKFKKGEYYSAIEYYKKDLDDRAKGPRANFMTGECYRVTNQIKEAEKYYKAAIDSRYPDETAILWYSIAE